MSSFMDTSDNDCGSSEETQCATPTTLSEQLDVSLTESEEIDQGKEYLATPSYKKSSYETEKWYNFLKNGKRVMLEVTTWFLYGEFILTLTDEEKEEVLALDNIDFNNYCSEFQSNENSCDTDIEIANSETYTPEELIEISELVHTMCGKTDHTTPIDECEEPYSITCDDCCFYNENLEEAGWSLLDTFYGFACSCELEEIED